MMWRLIFAKTTGQVWEPVSREKILKAPTFVLIRPPHTPLTIRKSNV